ncbi:MAG TPA: formate dehydrogenase accessory protein FdhE [Aggregatilineaceae bacterium]|nr:formate dehydrogenase accessory protein FdhE [Aggregatilineaceae bacterium]
MATENENSVMHHLQTLVREYHEISEAAEFYAALLPLLNTANLRAAPLDITPDAARAKLRSGTPLLHGMDLPIDAGAACNLLVRMARAIGSIPVAKATRPARSAFARHIQHLAEQERLPAAQLLQLVAVGHRDEVTALAEAWEVDADLLWLLAQYGLTPSLRQWARELAPLANGFEWHQSRCFVCGTQPLFGELQGTEASKHLRCGQCGADWAGRRLQCVFCGNDHLQTFRYMYLETHPNGRRVEACDKCKGYLKVIVTFDPTPPERLLIQDLATIHLDYVAQERGYVRGGSKLEGPILSRPAISAG